MFKKRKGKNKKVTMFETPALTHTPLLISHERHPTLFFSSTLTNCEVGEAQFEG